MRDLESTPKTGTELFNMIRDRYFWELNDQSASDLQLMKKKQKEDDPDEFCYMVMQRAEEGRCLIDNTRTSTSIEINNGIGKSHALDSDGNLANAQPGYVLGPNLRKEFPTNIVLTAIDLVKPVNIGDEIFYKIDPDVLHMSCFINWVSVDLDASFEKAFRSNQSPMSYV